MNFSTRPVEASDDVLLFDLYSSTREFEMAQVPWTMGQKVSFLRMQFAAQASSYAASHPGASHEMICVDGKAVGRIYWDRSPETLDILDITIARECRNRGLGSCLLERLISEADGAGIPLRIYIEHFNPSASLFRRLGFRPVATEGFRQLYVRKAGYGKAGGTEAFRRCG
ncbi:MAG: GNAT family N-acetyltransferase [Acidobacteriaceae bacterium]|nr:GNAT family N-acetyltransferase [Acidobacteriaceae bacterium]